MNRRTWGFSLLLLLLVGWASPVAHAQDAAQWKKMYEDSLNQLKAAQERKNQLAAENERLGQQIDAMKKEQAAMAARLEELKRADADHAEKTFFLRVHYMAWQQFMSRNVEVQAKWQKFLEGAALGGPDDPNLLNRKWLVGDVPASQPATGPTTRGAGDHAGNCSRSGDVSRHPSDYRTGQQPLSFTAIEPVVPQRRRRRLRVALLYARALIAEFRWTLFGLAAALVVGTLVIYLSPEVRVDGHPASVPMSLYSAWMALLAQPTLNPPPTQWLMFLFAVYPLLGFGLIGEGIVRLGFLMISRRRGEKEWTLVVAGTYRNHIVQCGLGHLGIRVLEQYVRSGIEVVVIEQDEKNSFLQRAREWNVPVLIADMKEDRSLLDAGIKSARAVVIATNNDVANLEVALDSRRMNPAIRIYMRLFDQQLATKITGAFGIDMAFSASALAAPIIAGMSGGANILSSAVIGGKPHVMAELRVEPGSLLAEKTVREIESAHATRVVALSDGATGDSVKTPPTGDDRAAAGASMTVHVAADGLAAIAAAARGE